MKSLIATGPGRIEIGEAPIPAFGPRQMLIETHVSAVSPGSAPAAPQQQAQEGADDGVVDGGRHRMPPRAAPSRHTIVRGANESGLRTQHVGPPTQGGDRLLLPWPLDRRSG
jgi:hypothetical protein